MRQLAKDALKAVAWDGCKDIALERAVNYAYPFYENEEEFRNILKEILNLK